MTRVLISHKRRYKNRKLGEPRIKRLFVLINSNKIVKNTIKTISIFELLLGRNRNIFAEVVFVKKYKTYNITTEMVNGNGPRLYYVKDAKVDKRC